MNDMLAEMSRTVLNEVGIPQEVHSSLISILLNLGMNGFSD